MVVIASSPSGSISVMIYNMNNNDHLPSVEISIARVVDERVCGSDYGHFFLFCLFFFSFSLFSSRLFIVSIGPNVQLG